MTPEILAAVQAGSPTVVQQILDEQWTESLVLEFKTVAGDRLTRDDRKTIAKAICGLCNADGGTLILGIETTKIDGLDTASQVAPIQNVRRFGSQLLAALPDMIQPAHLGIRVDTIVTATDAGINVVTVPTASDRPYMSTPASQFFRRTFDTTRLLDRSEIRDLYLVNRDASVRLKWTLRPAAATGDHFYFLSLALTVENVGKVLARAPYLTVGPESFFTEVMGGAIVRKTVSGRKGFYGTLDDVVHVDDETSLAFGPIGLRLRGLGPQDFAKWFVLNALEKRDSDAFLVNIGKPSSSREAVLPVEDVTFGAANALPKVERIAVTKLDVLTQFAAANGWT